MTTMSMFGSAAQSLFGNPRFIWNAAYTSFLIFGAFHITRISAHVFATILMGRFGKPSLVRETSKIHTHNYALIPFMYAKKFVNNNLLRRSEANLLKGVILEK